MRNEANIEFLGRGVKFPLTRIGRDYEYAYGEDLVLSSIPYILFTDSDSPFGSGEQPWDTEFGSVLRLSKYKSLSGDALRMLLEEDIANSLSRNEPRVILRDVDVKQEIIEKRGYLFVTILVSTIVEDNSRNDVRVGNSARIRFQLPY